MSESYKGVIEDMTVNMIGYDDVKPVKLLMSSLFLFLALCICEYFYERKYDK